jgi:hypothetical protein
VPRGLRYLSTAVVLGAAWGLLIAACSQPGDPIIGAGPSPTSVASAGPTPPPASVPVPVPTTAPDAPAGLRLALQAARDRWRISGPATYEHELTPTCRCEPGTLTARVIDDRLIGLPPVLPGPRTIDDWFDVIEAELAQGAHVEVRFDPDDGVPLDLLVDPDADVEGDEYGFETVAFTAVTDPLQRWFHPTATCGSQLGFETDDGSAIAVVGIGGADTSAGPLTPGLRFGPDAAAGWCPLDPDAGDAPDDAIEIWPLAAAGVEIVDTGARAARVTVGSAVAVAPDGDPIELGGATYEDVALDSVDPPASSDG